MYVLWVKVRVQRDFQVDDSSGDGPSSRKTLNSYLFSSKVH